MRNVFFTAWIFGTLLRAQAPSFDDLAARAESSVDTNPAKAVALFQQALAIRPDWADGWLYMGASFYHLGRFADARDALSKGSALAPTKGTPRAFIGLCEFELGDFDAALGHLLEGEKIGVADNAAFDASVRYHTALIYIRRNDFHHAVEQMQPLASNIKAFPDVLSLLGAGVLKIAQPVPKDKAALVALTGEATFAYYALHVEEAKTDFARLEAEYPREPGVHYAEGIYLLHDEPDRALEEFRKELQIRPDSPAAMQQIALLLLKNNRTQEAVEMARHAVQIDGSNALSQAAMGRTLMAAGKREEAVTALEQAVKLTPNDPQMHFHLEQAYRRSGRVEEARREKEEFNRLRELNDPLDVTPISVAR